MPLTTTNARYEYGNSMYSTTLSTYCQANTSASDYGKCYNVWPGTKAIFIQTDTTTWPIDSSGNDSFPCAKDGTCTRYTSAPDTLIVTQVFNYPGKQGILQYFWSRTHSNLVWYGNIQSISYIAIPSPITSTLTGYQWFTPASNYELSTWPIYDPVSNFKAYYNPYTITSGYVMIVRWSGNVFGSSVSLVIKNGYKNNVWYTFDVLVAWAYESSPLAIIPLDYDKEWLPYQELRNAFGYASTGVDQPGWNYQDIVSVLKEIYPDRAWAVFDDKTYTLYLYNLTPDFVPDWLINKLAPVAMKVLQSPSDSSIAKAWMDELNARNAYNQPQSGST